MIDPVKFKASVAYNKEVEKKSESSDLPNPLRLKINLSSLTALSNYNQVLLRPKYDSDAEEILDKVKTLSNLVPRKLSFPYSFNLDDVNGERVYDTNGQLLYIREYDNDTVKEYYPADKNKIKFILERDKNSSAVLSKIEPVVKNDGSVKTAVTIFDEKINNKYTILNAEEDGSIVNITEVSSSGKGFRTLFKNPYTNLPVRYLEAKGQDNEEFSLLDCRFDGNGEIKDIKRISSAKEVDIHYDEDKKIIDVKNKDND